MHWSRDVAAAAARMMIAAGAIALKLLRACFVVAWSLPMSTYLPHLYYLFSIILKRIIVHSRGCNVGHLRDSNSSYRLSSVRRGYEVRALRAGFLWCR